MEVDISKLFCEVMNMELRRYKTGNVRINFIWRRLYVTIVAVEEQ